MSSDTIFAPGTLIANRSRLWHVDAHEGGAPIATSIDGGRTEQCKFYAPFEDIYPDRLAPPSPDIVGHLSAQDLPLHVYHLSLPHSTASPISLQSCYVKDHQLTPMVMALETLRLRRLIVGLGVSDETLRTLIACLGQDRARPQPALLRRRRPWRGVQVC